MHFNVVHVSYCILLQNFPSMIMKYLATKRQIRLVTKVAIISIRNLNKIWPLITQNRKLINISLIYQHLK